MRLASPFPEPLSSLPPGLPVQFASSEERDARVAAVIYVDSATDGNEELAGYRWQEVRGLACDAALPASVPPCRLGVPALLDLDLLAATVV